MAKINKKTDKSNFFLSFLFYKYIIFKQRMRNEHTRNTWRTVCDYVANYLRLRNVRIILILWLFHEYLLLAKQKPTFCNVKTTFLHDKNHIFATQKPPF